MPYKRTYDKRRGRRPVKAKPKRMQRQVKRVGLDAIKSIVRREVHNNIENKQAAPMIFPNVLTQQMSSTTWGTLINLSNVWLINQGTGQGDRVGNSIKPLYWNIRGFLHYIDPSQKPCLVRLYVFKLKSGFASPSSGGALPTDFFQVGNTTTAPQGNMVDIVRQVNKDKYTVYTSRVFKMGPAVTSSVPGSSGGVTAANNDFHSARYFNINLIKYQSQKIKYNDSVGSPINSGLYVAFVAAPADGTTGGVSMPLISYDVIGSYEDA